VWGLVEGPKDFFGGQRKKNIFLRAAGVKYLPLRSAEVAQLVERQLPKLKVAGSNLVFRSRPKGD
jgi:hypothetical protein